ncbi:HNH endonuclease [Thiosocius teredinicola]|uniref:HNH endonuclease n=1 Tax=Thiosocius teredinicola TaxID=1973002 RepID=UPI000990E934
MPFSPQLREDLLVKARRRCCVCHKFAGRSVNVHHIVPESEGGPSTPENAIVLCLQCHGEAGHYNAKHPIGTKYSPTELVRHRDEWLKYCEHHPELAIGNGFEVSHKRKLAMAELHRYSLLVSYTNTETSPVDRCKLQLYFPMKVPVEGCDFDEYENEIVDQSPFRMLEMSLGDTIFPGETVQLIEDDGFFYLRYEMNDRLFDLARYEGGWHFMWRFFASNREPIVGRKSWEEMHEF